MDRILGMVERNAVYVGGRRTVPKWTNPRIRSHTTEGLGESPEKVTPGKVPEAAYAEVCGCLDGGDLMRTSVVVKRILTMKRLPNSMRGNPRWQVWFTDGDVRITQSDANVGFEINKPEHRNREVKVSLSKNGRITHIEVA